MSPSSNGGASNVRTLVLAAAVSAIVLLGAVVWWLVWRDNAGPDPVEAARLNSKGVGLMERFKYTEAAEVFEELAGKYPSWLPAKINLGIALLNQNEPATLERALRLFREVLAGDPNNLHAHYCAALILAYRAKLDEAAPHYETVTRLDPHDAAAWAKLGNIFYQLERMEKARACLDKAVALDPYNSEALYGLSQVLSAMGDDSAKQVLQRFKELDQSKRLNTAKLEYTRMGKYATAIGHDPSLHALAETGPLPLFAPADSFAVALAGGARWAASDDFGGAAGELRRAVRKRFGGVIVVLDFDQDGRLDLFLPGAVVENGKVRDLLLRNAGGGKFADVTAQAGLAGERPSLGCSTADFDNDGYPDLLITTADGARLFRNAPGDASGRRFEDVTSRTPLTGLKSVCLSALWLDLDQDSDLDLLVCRFANTPEEALASLKSGAKAAGAGVAVFVNAGEAPPASGADAAALTVAFQEQKLPGFAEVAAPAVVLAASDLERDNDIDIVALTDGGAPHLILNDRLLKFHRAALPENVAPDGRWNGVLVFNSNKDERSDLFLVRQGKKPLFLVNQPTGREGERARWFAEGATDSPPLVQAQALDLDLDGWMDVVGLSEDHRPVLLHNDGKRLAVAPSAFGLDREFANTIGMSVFDSDGDCHADLLVWSEKDGLKLKKNQGNGNHAANVKLVGLRSKSPEMRTNRDGIGAWVIVQAGPVWAAREHTTHSAGLGQSSQPLLFGMGKYARADVIRLRWPDNIWQAELDVPHGEPYVLRQTNRYIDSCPLLFTWDGERYVFLTDILGAGAIAEALPDGSHRVPRPEESLAIDGSQLRPKAGRYLLKICESREEVAYLDAVELVVVDHPSGMRVYPDERFVSDPAGPSQDLLAIRESQRVFPARATDHKGRDVTSALIHRDRLTADRFATRSWLGYAEDHWVELDFGERLAKFGPDEPLVLCLAGWTAYPYPEAMWAAQQAGVPLRMPLLERRTADGKWQTVLPELGFPAGMPRLITADVTGKLTGPSCTVRIRTNMQVYWDQVFLVPVAERVPKKLVAESAGRATVDGPKLIRSRVLNVDRAVLAFRGLLQDFSPDGRQPDLFDYDRVTRVPLPRISGKLTRFGPVTELLQEHDDRFVIMGPGDEVTIEFDAATLPPLPEGWSRSFVLRTAGYSKSCGPFITSGGAVEPLPFRGMSNYPYRANERYPQTPAHVEYVRKYLTREIGR